jgi:hypothetical protein
VPDSQTTTDKEEMHLRPLLAKSKDTAVNMLAPGDGEWGTWE